MPTTAFGIKVMRARTREIIGSFNKDACDIIQDVVRGRLCRIEGRLLFPSRSRATLTCSFHFSRAAPMDMLQRAVAD